jgi:hypothetical protein
MTQFAYRLQPLLEQKERIRKERESEKIQCEREVEEQIAKLHLLENQQQALVEKREQLRRGLLNQQSPDPTTGRDATERVAYIKAVGVQIEDAKMAVLSQRQVIADCEIRLDEAKQRVEEARREVEVLEKHRAKQEQRFHRVLQVKEELELDEVGNVLYTTRRRQT